MRIDLRVVVLVAMLVLAPNFFAYAAEAPASASNDSGSDTPAQPPSETAPTEPDKTRAEGAENIKPFTPSESISADSAVAFPVDI